MASILQTKHDKQPDFSFITKLGIISCHKRVMKNHGPIIDVYLKMGILNNKLEYELNGFDHNVVLHFIKWVYEYESTKIDFLQLLEFLDLLDFLQIEYNKKNELI
jgi:hypothetical protein